MRSKCALAANLIITLYAVIFFWLSVGSMIYEYGTGFFVYQKEVLQLILADLEIGTNTYSWLYIVLLLFYGNILLYGLSAVLGWIGFAAKKSGAMLWSAIFCLLGTICFPVCILTGIPAIILSFAGYSNQKKLNRSAVGVTA